MIRTKKICDKCQREISRSNYERHLAVCNGPKIKKIRGIDYDPNAGYADGSRIAWNKGLTKETDERVKRGSELFSERYQNGEFDLGGWNQTIETRQLLSEIRKAYLEENPDQIPYVLYHKSKGKSYPEQYFDDILKQYNINNEFDYPFGPYLLDFAILNKMIDLEIDGSQHRVDPVIVEHDIIRDDYVSKKGWRIIRVYWPDYQKMRRIEKEQYIETLIKDLS